MRNTFCVLALILVSLSAAAGTITSIDPTEISTNGGEHFMTISGRELGSVARFSGQAGTFDVEGTGDSTRLVVWVPGDVIATTGTHSVQVLGGPTGDSNSASFTVYDPDPVPLTVAPGDPITWPAEGPDGARVFFDVVAYGGRDPNPTVTCDPPSGSLFRIGPTYVTCVARNSFGETAQGGRYIYVYDAGAPVVTVPGRIVVEAEGPDGTVVTFNASARDAVDGDLPVTCTPASGSRFPIGETLVECTATDSSLNPGSATFTVEVTGEAPQRLVIHVPDPITVDAESPEGTDVPFTVTADGTSDPDPDITCTPASGSVFPIGTTTVQCTATDSAGNTASDSFTVTVRDTTPPVISSVTASPSVIDSRDGSMVAVTVTVEASDAADPMPRCSIIGVTSNEDISGDVNVTGDLTLELRAARDTDVRRYVIEVQCTDSANLSAQGETTVSVTGQNQEPETLVIHVPGPITVEAESSAGTVVTFTVTADGTSDPNPEITCTPASGSAFPLGTTTVQCTATDSFDNTDSDSFTVTVRDTMPPVISSITASPDEIKAPNKKMELVTLTVEVSDAADPMPQCMILGVTSNEDITGDVNVTGDLTVELRADRDTEERLYVIAVQCSDDAGFAANGEVTVRVPRGNSDQQVISDPPAQSTPTRKGFSRWW